jgi:HlyD family secretion protein
VTENNTTRGDPELRRKLGLDGAKRGHKWLKRVIILLVVAGVVGGLVFWRIRARAEDAPDYVEKKVERGDLRVTVNATGSLDALETVDVGAEVSGRIEKVLVDYNETVEKGQVLAVLDTEQLDARLREAKARLRSARASERAARATSKEAKQAADRSVDLAKRGLISQAALESSLAAAERARANVGAASAQTAIAEATLLDAQNNVDRATIESPIDGIVLSRNVEAGQTLASTFQVPVLFRIAKDLSQMELSVAIDEADIGRVKEGQKATFTVDAYPGRTFESSVRSLRNVPTVEQNVVTYEAILAVDNTKRFLRPGMTATATIVTETIEDVVLVPMGALRFTPPEVTKRESDKPEHARVIDKDAPKHRVWFLKNGKPESIGIDVGPSDGQHAQLLEGELEPGTMLLVDLRVKNEEKR